MNHRTLSTILTKNITTSFPNITVSEVLQIMVQEHLSSLIVVDHDNHPIGIFTEHDSLKVVSGDVDPNSLLGDVMSKKIFTNNMNDDIHDAYMAMSTKGYRHLIVVDDKNKLQGVVTQGDFLRHIGFDNLALTKTVSDVMIKKIIILEKEETLAHAALEMQKQHSDYAVIVENMCPTGLLTERDVLHFASSKNIMPNDPISLIYNTHFPIIYETTSLADAALMMEEHNVHQLIITNEAGNLTGLLTRYALLQAMHGSYFNFLIQQVETKNIALDELHNTYEQTLQDKEELVESEKRFRTLFDMLPDGVVLIDAQSHQTVESNTVMAQQLGYTPDEFKTLRIDDYDVSFNAQEIDAHIDTILHNGKLEFETMHRRKDGSLMDVHVTTSPLLIKEKSYLLTHIIDITQKKLRKKRLNAQLELLETLASNLPMQKLLETIIYFVEEQCIGIKCSILLVDEPTQTLKNGAAPTLPEDYNNFVEGISIASGNGSCPTACALGKPVIVTDVYTDPLWAQYKELITPYKWLKGCWSTPFFDSDKKVLGTFAFYSDTSHAPTNDEQELMTYSSSLAGIIVERFVRQKVYEKQATFLHTLINTIPDLIWLKDTNGIYLTCNKMFEQFFNAKEEDIIGKTDYAFINKEMADLFKENDNKAMQTDLPCTNEEYLTFADGSVEGVFSTTKIQMKAADGETIGVLGVSRNITEQKAHETQLELMANYDSLTGLANRSFLHSQLQRSIDKARRNKTTTALLMFDLDRFKDVNDSFGHSAGDEILILVAKRFSERLREEDMISRLGGDEFAVIMEHILRPEDAARVSEDIIETLTTPFELSNGLQIHIGVSVGIVLFPDNGKNVEELMQHADAALYRAKNDGRGTYRYYTDELTQFARDRIILEAKLRTGIDNNELRVFYQPQVHIATGQIIGAEALVRWQHPTDGLISPANFIPLAEETGLINKIGEWVLRETCRQGKIWLDQGHRLTLAVNLSVHQIRHQNIPQLVEAVLKETNYPANRLELELTESSLMQREEESVAILHALRAKGIRLAIDDFGTGYSSLAYLKRFPIDVLKIDKSFIDDIPYDKDDMAIAIAIIAMGKALDFTILAEGTEKKEQIDFLQQHGCDIYQGYYKSPPVPAEEFIKLLS